MPNVKATFNATLLSIDQSMICPPNTYLLEVLCVWSKKLRLSLTGNVHSQQ